MSRRLTCHFKSTFRLAGAVLVLALVASEGFGDESLCARARPKRDDWACDCKCLKVSLTTQCVQRDWVCRERLPFELRLKSPTLLNLKTGTTQRIEPRFWADDETARLLGEKLGAEVQAEPFSDEEGFLAVEVDEAGRPLRDPAGTWVRARQNFLLFKDGHKVNAGELVSLFLAHESTPQAAELRVRNLLSSRGVRMVRGALIGDWGRSQSAPFVVESHPVTCQFEVDGQTRSGRCYQTAQGPLDRCLAQDSQGGNLYEIPCPASLGGGSFPGQIRVVENHACLGEVLSGEGENSCIGVPVQAFVPCSDPRLIVRVTPSSRRSPAEVADAAAPAAPRENLLRVPVLKPIK